MLTESCPTCDGTGYVKSRYTVCYEVLRELRASCRKGEGKQFNVYLAPEVARLSSKKRRDPSTISKRPIETKINIICQLLPDHR